MNTKLELEVEMSKALETYNRTDAAAMEYIKQTEGFAQAYPSEYAEYMEARKTYHEAKEALSAIIAAEEV